ncbi:LysR substrate-binding domain-containing protein [Hoeflea sp. TYP-13]|uniref:LysR substrate-binding domain-containing protein n=1 Tax=Hoeflea sp. TYP-13 TaxID=3230023 RepID=UPI0034C5CB72
MRNGLPPLPALQAFEAAARHESFASAAEELHLSQSAVSHRVRMLERHLGYSLFERLPRGLRLTENAKAYLPSVRKAFDMILGSTSGIFGPSGEAVVTVRAPVSYSALWLTRLIDGFMTQYSDIEVRLVSSVWADRLAADETDLEFRLGHGHWPGYRAELVLRDPVLPVCSPSACAHRAMTASELAEQPLIHVLGTEDHWSLYFAAHGVGVSERLPHVRLDSSMAAAELAASGNRFALLQKRLVDPYLQYGRLVRASDHELAVDQGLYLLRSENADRMTPEAILLRGWLLHAAGDMSR